MRPLAIELAFDSASDQRLGQLWSSLSGLYGARSNSELGVRPHITLTLFRDDEPGDISHVAASVASEIPGFGVDLSTVDRFPGSEGVVFLRPEASPELARAHALVHELLAGDRDLVDGYYRPSKWQPHCTVAIGVPEKRMETVLSACRSSGAVGSVRVARVQMVRYLPATEVWGATLASGV